MNLQFPGAAITSFRAQSWRCEACKLAREHRKAVKRVAV
jgi:hypothetical protein